MPFVVNISHIERGHTRYVYWIQSLNNTGWKKKVVQSIFEAEKVENMAISIAVNEGIFLIHN